MSNLDKKVAIVDYGIGNLFSVARACEAVGINAVITNDRAEIETAAGLILPGVGAFGDAMDNLRKLDLELLLKEYSQTGKPLMGVCLGMQLLMEESEEFGNQKGLGIIGGRCVRFASESDEHRKIRVPQIMWNSIYPEKDQTKFRSNTPLESIKVGEYMYFVHSYYVIPNDPKEILSQTNYAGQEFCSSVAKGNIFAFQFHPEKSGMGGLNIYQSFKKLI